MPCLEKQFKREQRRWAKKQKKWSFHSAHLDAKGHEYMKHVDKVFNADFVSRITSEAELHFDFEAMIASSPDQLSIETKIYELCQRVCESHSSVCLMKYTRKVVECLRNVTKIRAFAVDRDGPHVKAHIEGLLSVRGAFWHRRAIGISRKATFIVQRVVESSLATVAQMFYGHRAKLQAALCLDDSHFTLWVQNMRTKCLSTSTQYVDSRIKAHIEVDFAFMKECAIQAAGVFDWYLSFSASVQGHAEFNKRFDHVSEFVASKSENVQLHTVRGHVC